MAQARETSTTPRETESPRIPATTGSIVVTDRTNMGKTHIADDVVTTNARVAAEQVPGVYKLGDTGLRGMLNRVSKNQGVDSEVGKRQAAITLDVVVEYGERLSDVAQRLRDEVIEAVQYMADREVVAVDINVVDVHFPEREQPRTRALE